MLDKTEDKLASARAQGQAQFDSIVEMVNALADSEPDESRDAAHEAIQEDALSVEVRSGWVTPGMFVVRGDPRTTLAPVRPAEYTILLCTGGPACRIIGELSEHGEPETARLQVQDWFTPWTDMRPLVAPDDYDSEPILLEFACCFYFGE